MEEVKKQFTGLFDNVETILFCDETKFSVNDKDYDNSIFYLAVSMHKDQKVILTNELDAILIKHNVVNTVFHATRVFKKRTLRLELISDLTDLIIRHNLHCFCFKYNSDLLFEITKSLEYLNTDIHRFDSKGYQALFYFITFFNTFLIYDKPALLKRQLVMFFDRNVYGREETDEFDMPEDTYVIKRLSFTDKSNLPLLALPDFFGYIFRKSRLSQNKAAAGAAPLETDLKVITCYSSFLRIQNAHLFHYLDLEGKIEQYSSLLLVHYGNSEQKQV